MSGLSGSSPSINGQSIASLSLIESRTVTQLLQTLLGSSQATDDLDNTRNDQAFALQLPQPVVGNGR